MGNIIREDKNQVIFDWAMVVVNIVMQVVALGHCTRVDLDIYV